MRKEFLPFSRPMIGQDEIREVTDSLRSGWITTGPKVQQFEKDFAAAAGSQHAVSVNSATAGLHIAYLAAGLKHGDEVITTPMTFISTVSMLAAVGAKPVLADIDPKTLNLDCDRLEAKITRRTRAVVPVHFAGLPCDMDRIGRLARKHKLKVIEDAAHAAGTEYKGKKVGSMSDATVFSFHPIKNMTTGEGGMVTTRHAKWAEEMGLLRFHGMSKNAWKRYAKSGNPHYDILRLAYKYNMMDIQAAIGIHQLRRLAEFNAMRLHLARRYRNAFAGIQGLGLQGDPDYEHAHAWHLFVAMVDERKLEVNRDGFVRALAAENIGTGIHFTAVHRHAYYKKMFAAQRKDLPQADWVSDRILSLPLYPRMTDQDSDDVIGAVKKIVQRYSRRKLVAVP